VWRTANASGEGPSRRTALQEATPDGAGGSTECMWATLEAGRPEHPDPGERVPQSTIGHSRLGQTLLELKSEL
jgi:hypothetical protein